MYMYRLLVFLSIFLIPLYTIAQNIVPNSSFELLKKLPCQPIANSADNISNYVYNWRTPTGGTSDIYLNTPTSTTCSSLKLLGLAAHSGISCAGFFTLGASPELNNLYGGAAYREYIQVKLTQKLVVGKVYYVEFYVATADANTAPYTSLYSNNLGCYFSVDSISLPTNQFGVLAFKPQINETNVLAKPGYWYKVSGCFQANEAAQYITLGNFFGDQQTKYTTVNQSGHGAYYLIDDVSVQETIFTSIPALAISDTILCSTQPISIQLPNVPSLNYVWQDSSSQSTYIISHPGLYSVTATSGFCMIADTFRVSQVPTLKLPLDTIVCTGIPYSITVVDSTTSALTWSDGSHMPTLSVNNSGVYWVKSQLGTCIQTDSIKVTFTACPGEVPNVFTPNNDGINDVFYIDGITSASWQLEVINRWGRVVYKSETYKNDWTGEGLSVGIYYYLLSNDKLQKQLKGWLQLIR